MIYSGAQFSTSTPALPPIVPQIVGGGVALLTLRGVCDGGVCEGGLEAACSNLRKSPAVHRVVLRVDSDLTTACPGDLMELVARLDQVKPVFAFIEVALGGAFLVALQAHAIVAHPQAAIGRLRSRVLDDSADDGVRQRLDALNEATADIVALHRPAIEPRITQWLLDNELAAGEVLEHYGLADDVMLPEELIATLGGTKP